MEAAQNHGIEDIMTGRGDKRREENADPKPAKPKAKSQPKKENSPKKDDSPESSHEAKGKPGRPKKWSKAAEGIYVALDDEPKMTGGSSSSKSPPKPKQNPSHHQQQNHLQQQRQNQNQNRRPNQNQNQRQHQNQKHQKKPVNQYQLKKIPQTRNQNIKHQLIILNLLKSGDMIMVIIKNLEAKDTSLTNYNQEKFLYLKRN